MIIKVIGFAYSVFIFYLMFRMLSATRQMDKLLLRRPIGLITTAQVPAVLIVVGVLFNYPWLKSELISCLIALATILIIWANFDLSVIEKLRALSKSNNMNSARKFYKMFYGKYIKIIEREQAEKE